MFRRKERVRTIATPNQVDSGALAAARSLGKALKSDGKSVDYAKLPKYNAPSRSSSMLGLNNVVSQTGASRRYSLTNEPGSGPRSSGPVRRTSNVRRYQQNSTSSEHPRTSSLPSNIGRGGTRITRKQRQEAQDTFQEFGGSQVRSVRAPVIRRRRNDERRLSVQQQQQQQQQPEPPTIKKFVPGRNGLMAVEIPNPNYRPPVPTRKASGGGGGTLRRSTSLQANLGLRARRVSSMTFSNQIRESQLREERLAQKEHRRASSLTSSGDKRSNLVQRKPKPVTTPLSAPIQTVTTTNRTPKITTQTTAATNGTRMAPRQSQIERTLDPEAQSPTSNNYSSLLSATRPPADYSISSSQFSTPLIETTVPEESELDLQEDQLFSLDNINGTANSSFMRYGQRLGTVSEGYQQDEPSLDSDVIREIRGGNQVVKKVNGQYDRVNNNDEIDDVSITTIGDDGEVEESEGSESGVGAEESDLIRPIVVEGNDEPSSGGKLDVQSGVKSNQLGPETETETVPGSLSAIVNDNNAKINGIGEKTSTLIVPTPAPDSTANSFVPSENSSTQPLALPEQDYQDEQEEISSRYSATSDHGKVTDSGELPALGNLVSRIMSETPDSEEVYSTPLQEMPKPPVRRGLGSGPREDLMKQLKLEESKIVSNMLEDLKNVHGEPESPPEQLEQGTVINTAAHARGKTGIDTPEQVSVASSDVIKDVRGSVERIIGRIDAVGSGSVSSSRQNTPLSSRGNKLNANHEAVRQMDATSPGYLESRNLAQTLRSVNPYLTTGSASTPHLNDVVSPPPPIINYHGSVENLTTPTRRHPLMVRGDNDVKRHEGDRANRGANVDTNRLSTSGLGVPKNSTNRVVTPIKSAMKKTSTPSTDQSKAYVDDSPALHAYLSLTTAENTRLNAQITGDGPQPVRQTVPRKVVRPQSMISSIQRKNVPTGKALEQKKVKRHSSIERSASQSRVTPNRRLAGSSTSTNAKQSASSQIARPVPTSARQTTKHLSMISRKPQATKSATRAAMLSHKMSEERNTQQDNLNSQALEIVKKEMDLNAILYPMEPLEKKSSFQKSHHTENGVAFKHMSLRDQAFMSSGSLITEQPSNGEPGRSSNWTSRFHDSDSDDERPLKKLGINAKTEARSKKSSSFSLFKSKGGSGSNDGNLRPPQYTLTGSSPSRSLSTPVRASTPRTHALPSPTRAVSESVPRTSDGAQQQRHHHTLGLSLGKSHSHQQANTGEQDEASPRRKQGLGNKLKKLFGRRKSEY